MVSAAVSPAGVCGWNEPGRGHRVAAVRGLLSPLLVENEGGSELRERQHHTELRRTGAQEQPEPEHDAQSEPEPEIMSE